MCVGGEWGCYDSSHFLIIETENYNSKSTLNMKLNTKNNSNKILIKQEKLVLVVGLFVLVILYIVRGLQPVFSIKILSDGHFL